jgi:hypothetical protein
MHHNNRQAFVCGQIFMPGLRALAIVLILGAVAPVRGHTPNSNLATERKLRHWHKYVNNKYGFSFWYPEPYKPVPLPPPDAGDEFRYYEKRLLLLERRDDPDAKLWITLDTRPFDLSTLSHSHSPTGWGPDWIPPGGRIGTHVFYGYGAGGGGVAYPDQFFVKLRGKTLEFLFDGPYEGKRPGGETPDLEPKILKSFRVR